MKMRTKRYKVSLLNFDEDELMMVSRRRSSLRRITHVVRRMPWQQQIALICVMVGIILLIWRFA
ncbi:MULTISPECIES: hypothetical protein [Candidatus Chloroploca]|uniref:Uncharacterized protein n=1 Tax=Candidatus Chloroploca asiatica TaxID=1506545 RepID=A0A2H3L814_9CHLR|nr:MULTISPECIES: hypothetical protein [Candidatus Chloroploca]PDW01408.1 hypothetical protein A9Q02_20920 [Candidatus Chloroploca asiatica]